MIEGGGRHALTIGCGGRAAVCSHVDEQPTCSATHTIRGIYVAVGRGA